MIYSLRLLLLLALPMAVLLATNQRPLIAEGTAPLPPPSTFLPLHEVGDEWGADEYAPAIAFGDIDGDGRDEIAVSRRATAGARVLVLDDATTGFAPLWSFGEGWGVASWVTALAFGNIDDDPAEELAFTRMAAVNERVWVVDDAAAGFAFLERFGEDWPDTVSAVGVAFGDIDGDGRDEIGVITDTSASDRVHVFDDATAGFAPLWDGDETWGAASVATSIAFGDVDGDGVDELAVTRRHDINARLFLYDDAAPSTAQVFGLLWQYGEGWGPGSYATGVAFGNVDDDPAEEIGLTRQATLNERAYIFDDAAANYVTLQTFGESWAANAWSTAIAFGDVDSDGRDEVALSRVATINPRVFVHDDAAPGDDRPAFKLLWGGGAEWPGGIYATSVAFGNVDANSEMELGLGRFAAEGPRAYLLGRGWATWLPFTSIPKPLPADH